MDSDCRATVENVSKKYCKDLRRSLWYGLQDIAAELNVRRRVPRPALRPGEFWALEGVSFELRRGEALGIMGPNGAGKSGLLKPDAGRITIRGRVAALIELGTGFNPILTGRENIYVNAAVLGMSKRQVDRIVGEMIDFAGIQEFIDTPVRNYSSGMWVRLGYAVAAHLNPDVLLVDEVLAVGDQAFRRKCLRHMLKYLQNGGSLVLVSHDMYLLQAICSSGLLIDRGQIHFAGTAVEAVDRYFAAQRSVESDRTAYGGQAVLDDDHPVIIDKVEISPLRGDELRTGQDARITVYYRSIRMIDGVFWGFGIWGADQLVCITGDVAGVANDTYRVAKGSGQFRCTLPKLPLVDGAYALRAFIGDAETGVLFARFGWENAPTFFATRSKTSEVSNLLAMGGSLVKIDVRWEECAA
jgi:lipopolysaccharide transport system ATP-binding protein